MGAEFASEDHPDSLSQRLAVGKIKASHGLKGYLKVKSLSGETAHFLRFKQVYIRYSDGLRPFSVQDVIVRSGDLLLKLSGIEDREAGDGVRGREIWVPRRDALQLAEGEYYLTDLCRCRVFQKGREIGRVAAVCDGGPGELLEVVSPDGKTLIIPFSGHFVDQVDIPGAVIELTEEYELP